MVTVRIIGQRTPYQAADLTSAIMGLPDRHGFARIWTEDALGTDLPGTQLLSDNPPVYGVHDQGNLRVGDIIDVIHMGPVQDSGGGKFAVIKRRRMRVAKLTSRAVMTSGDAEDGEDFVATGIADFAVLSAE